MHTHPARHRVLPQPDERRDPRRGEERDAVEVDDDVRTNGEPLVHPPVEPRNGQAVEIAADVDDGERLGDVPRGDLQGGRLTALTQPWAGDDEAGLGHEWWSSRRREQWMTGIVRLITAR